MNKICYFGPNIDDNAGGGGGVMLCQDNADEPWWWSQRAVAPVGAILSGPGETGGAVSVWDRILLGGYFYEAIF